ncbi:hypothetical protein [Paenibacillus sedimenti]|uniref:Uncharacterized protein n=1 Tax=Paenibacillus sedimenti TaxID=2770274 RepID=A0A926QK31_9BACL|nr:hypothetical protein [Paenibacillus sedimenti]
MKIIIISAKQVKPDYIEILPSFSHPKIAAKKKRNRSRYH